MPDLAKIAAVSEKLGLPVEGAEPAPENATAPPDGASDAGSAPTAVGDGAQALSETSPGATINRDALKAKLDADRARREERTRRKQLEESEAAAKRAREEAEADRKAAAEERAKWDGVGKKKTWLETIKEAGRDPRQAFEEMKAEALKAGTPEARMEAMERAFEARHEALEAQLKQEREAREADRKERETERAAMAAERQRQAFVSDFEYGIKQAQFADLLDEYPPDRLFAVVDSLAKNPPALFGEAERLGVDLTSEDGTYTMENILTVLAETQKRHRAYQEEQRRKKQAAPQTSPGGQQPPSASKPTVNGTADRNAGTSVGNQLASTRATDAVSRKKETREERVARLGSKFG